MFCFWLITGAHRTAGFLNRCYATFDALTTYSGDILNHDDLQNAEIKQYYVTDNVVSDPQQIFMVEVYNTETCQYEPMFASTTRGLKEALDYADRTGNLNGSDPTVTTLQVGYLYKTPTGQVPAPAPVQTLGELLRSKLQPEKWEHRVIVCLNEGKIVGAIKELREAGGLGLKEAKDIIDTFRHGDEPLCGLDNHQKTILGALRVWYGADRYSV